MAAADTPASAAAFSNRCLGPTRFASRVASSPSRLCKRLRNRLHRVYFDFALMSISKWADSKFIKRLRTAITGARTKERRPHRDRTGRSMARSRRPGCRNALAGTRLCRSGPATERGRPALRRQRLTQPTPRRGLSLFADGVCIGQRLPVLRCRTLTAAETPQRNGPAHRGAACKFWAANLSPLRCSVISLRFKRPFAGQGLWHAASGHSRRTVPRKARYSLPRYWPGVTPSIFLNTRIR